MVRGHSSTRARGRKPVDLENRFDNYGNWTFKVTLEEKKGFDGFYYVVKEVEKRSLTYFS
jgi:hypothetical protein